MAATTKNKDTYIERKTRMRHIYWKKNKNATHRWFFFPL